MLTGAEIRDRVRKDEIYITDFDESRLNPNSYNLRLSDTLMVYDTSDVLDVKKDNEIKLISIPDEGYVLEPGILYLASTIEITKCYDLIPCIDGRSSIGRLGIFTHVTAGFGDIGFAGKWTLEITVVHPIRIYKGMEICQIYFEEPCGSTEIKYKGKYQYQDNPIKSKIYEEFSDNK